MTIRPGYAIIKNADKEEFMKNFFGFCEDRKETDGAPFIIRSVGEKLQKD